MGERGETLSDSALAQARPVRGEGGKSLRAFCPFHGGDKQRSLRVEVATGRFQCFACGVWGYLESAREQFKASQPRGMGASSLPRKKLAVPKPPPPPPPPAPMAGLAEILAGYQRALPGSLGAEYLEERGIPLEFAQRYGIGYAAPRQWAHRGANGEPVRDYRYGRLVFPHTNPAGELVNLYGRAVGERAPKQLRHDHLAGAKGYFHAAALAGPGPVYVCEGPFDALSLMLARPGLEAVAIFGVQGWRHDWAAGCREVVFALDADPAGTRAWKALARELVLRGKTVRYLEAESYGGAKDVNEAWIAGNLEIE